MYYFSVYILKTNQRTLLCLKKTPPLSGKASAKIKTQKEINKKIKQKMNLIKITKWDIDINQEKEKLKKRNILF